MSGFQPAEFRALFERNRDLVFRFLCRLTGNAADADDLLQDTFVTIWRKRDRFEGRGSPEGYVLKTAFRLYLNHREKSRRRARLAPVEGTAEAAPGRGPGGGCAARAAADVELRSLLHRRVQEAVDALPDGARETWILFREEGMNCPAIADATGVHLKTVESRLRRAREVLRERLAGVRDQMIVRDAS